MRDAERRAYMIVLSAGLFLSFFAMLGAVPLFDLDEGAFSEATREMVTSGDYLTTYLNGHLRFDKPILIYWLQAASAHLLGFNAFAMRLPSAIAATLWVVALYRFVRREAGKKRAFFAAFFMLSSLQISIIAKAAIADALLNLFIALTMFMIYRYYREGRRRELYLAYLFMALGTLTKGPVAILIPFVVSGLFFLLQGAFKRWLKAIFDPVGIGLFLLVAGPWYLLEYREQGQKFVEGFFLKHNLHRFSSPMEGHWGSIFYYVPVLLVGTLPFSALIVRPLAALGRIAQKELHLFLLLWFGFVFLFFSFSGTKLPHYVIYGYTPLFILAALYLPKRIGRIATVVPVSLLYLALIAGPLYLKLHGLGTITQPQPREILRDGMHWFDTGYFLALVAALLATLAAGWNRIRPFVSIVIVGLVFVATLNLVVLPTIGRIKQLPIKEAAQIAKHYRAPIYSYHITTPSFNFYLKARTRTGTPSPGALVYTKSKELKTLKNYDMIYRKGGVALIKMKEF